MVLLLYNLLRLLHTRICGGYLPNIPASNRLNAKISISDGHRSLAKSSKGKSFAQSSLVACCMAKGRLDYCGTSSDLNDTYYSFLEQLFMSQSCPLFESLYKRLHIICATVLPLMALNIYALNHDMEFRKIIGRA